MLSHAQGDQVLLRFLHNFPTNKEHPGHCSTLGESPKKMRRVCILPLLNLCLHCGEEENLNQIVSNNY